MYNFSLAELAAIVGGEVFGDSTFVVTGISTDSRSIKSGDLFCAIVGERTDGHNCVEQALASGALATLATKPVSGNYILIPTNSDPLDSVIVAVGLIAQAQRAKMADVSVIGITGSSGKTSTKDLIGQVLNTHGVTQAPVGSPNNELGMPLTILSAPTDTEYLVLEMGMRGLGHIKYLCNIAKPNIGVVTNVGQAHIGEVGSMHGIAQAKGELIESLPETGFAVLNADDPLVRNMQELTSARTVTFGFSDFADVRGENLAITQNGTYTFDLVFEGKRVPATLPMLGEHNVSNALAATAVGLISGMSLQEIVSALEQTKQVSKWRMEVHDLPHDVLLINDSYNANPESMAAALKTLVSIPRLGRTWAVLGAMHELGDVEVSEHDRIGRLAVDLNVSHIVSIGNQARPIYLGATQVMTGDGESVWYPDFAQASDYIVNEIQPGDVIIFKASRAEKFEVLAEDIESRLVDKWTSKGSSK
jgi:UDP-N-acetylmuramoyl-tripeptide--D-alanyl-D-alanine ligase